MRIFIIARGIHIQVTQYSTYSDDKGRSGVEIKIKHNVPIVAGKQLQWVQTVSSNGGNSKACKMMTRVDPFGVGGPVNTISLPGVPGIGKADDRLPFYWTAQDLAGGAGPGFSDKPAVHKPATGRTWTQFITALTEVTGKDVHHLVAIAWGYDRMSDGTVRVAPIRTPTSTEMSVHYEVLKTMYPLYKYT